MDEKPKQSPFDELRGIFEEAAVKAREAWASARQRSEEAKNENETYRELVSLSSAAWDVLDRAVRKAWGAGESK